MTYRTEFPRPTPAHNHPSDAAEANHRIANSLSLAAAQLRTERRAVTDPAASAALGRAEARLSAIALFHKSLYRDGGDRIDFVDRLSDMLPVIREALGIECALTIDGVGRTGMTNGRAMQLMIAVNELILNATKHGRDGDGLSHITLDLSRADDGRLRLVAHDGGAGLPDGFLTDGTTGMGMRVVSRIVEQLGGTLHAETDGGAKFTITVSED